jgi:hypothetical protein
VVEEGQIMQSTTERPILADSIAHDPTELTACESAIDVQVQLDKALGLMDVFSHRNKELAREVLIIALQKHRLMMEKMGWNGSSDRK